MAGQRAGSEGSRMGMWTEAMREWVGEKEGSVLVGTVG